MRFSIIVPVYNTSAYLADCLDSVAGQTFDDYEVVCVDDGSTDSCPDILERYRRKDPRIVVVSQPNRGIGYARNIGLQAAQGEYVLFLDSDDWLEQDTLQLLSQQLEGEDILCFGGRRYFDDLQVYEETDALQAEAETTGWQYYCRHALEPRHFAFVCVVLRCYRRTLIINNGLQFKEGIFHEDNLFTPQACYYARRVKVIPDNLYTYRVRKHSIMTSRGLTHWQHLIETANELAAFFIEKHDVEKKVVYRAITHHYQAAFAASDRGKDCMLRPLVDWGLYRRVSRTKFRHRMQYFLIRHHPPLFRLINKMFEQ